MQHPARKKRASSLRPVPLLLLALTLIASLAALLFWVSRPAPVSESRHKDEPVLLMNQAAENIHSIAVTLRTGQGWTAVQTQPGLLTLEDDPDFVVSDTYAAPMLQGAAVIEAPAVLTDDPALWKPQLADFGLADPRLVMEIAYSDGSRITLRIGDRVYEDARYYMIVDGDDRLFTLDQGTADLFTLDRSLLRHVTQPILHHARFDRITLTGADGQVIAEWSLAGQIGDSDAADRWFLTQPFTYPADAQAMTSLKNHIANLRLGAYVTQATRESLTEYGFDQPRLTLDVHQAAGDMGSVSLEGEYTLTSWPESTFSLVVGGAMNEDVDYLLCDGAVYTGSRYALQTLSDLRIIDTLTRYPVITALGNLEKLSITSNGETTIYDIIRTEQVAENNDLVYDLTGQIVYNYTVYRNGEAIDYAAFASAYSRLITVTVSGELPAQWVSNESPHTVMTFHDRSGEIHTIALTPYDALHDAVVVDGHAVFYLIQGGLALAE